MMPDPPTVSLGDVLRRLRSELDGSLRDEAETLLLGVLGLQRNVLFSRPETPVPAAELARLERASARLAQGEPLAYVLGHQGFWNFDLQVDPAVLIPRPDTEVLVRAALDRVPLRRAQRLADLGTGSGAVAMALAVERPEATVVAVDRSLAALRVAQGNIQRHALPNVLCVAGDWLAPIGGHFDLIASNPPYLADDDPHLGRDGLDREPRDALVSGRDGLDAIRSIAIQGNAALKPGGWLLLEHGWEQGAAVRGLLEQAGYQDVSTVRDLADRERVSLARVRPA